MHTLPESFSLQALFSLRIPLWNRDDGMVVAAIEAPSFDFVPFPCFSTVPFLSFCSSPTALATGDEIMPFFSYLVSTLFFLLYFFPPL